jgi:hypothetical protein
LATAPDDHLVLHLLYVEQQHRCRGVARALTEHVCAAYQGRIILGAWDRDLVEVWVKLGFVYEPPAEGERPPLCQTGVTQGTNELQPA